MTTWAICHLWSVLPMPACGSTSFSRARTGSDRAAAHRWRLNEARSS